MTYRYREVRSMWDWLCRREVWRYTDGRVQLVGFSARAAIRWHRRHYHDSSTCLDCRTRS
jgi:hypothetical protein